MATTITTTRTPQDTLTRRRKNLPAKKRYGDFSHLYESNLDLPSSPSLTHSLVLFDDLLRPRRGFFQRTWHRISGSLRSSFDACVRTISTSFQPLLAVFCINVPVDK